MRCTKKMQTCSWHWSTKRTQFFSMIMPGPMLHNKHFKVEKIGLWSFASSAIFTWPLANLLPLLHHLDNFLQGKCFHNQQDTENAFQDSIESWGTNFYATGINKHFLLAKMCTLWTVAIYFSLNWVFIVYVGFLQLQQEGLLSSCGAQASHSSGFSCWEAQASLIMAWGLSSCGPRL